LCKFGGLSSVFDEWHVSAALTKRFTPLQLPAPITEQIAVTFNFPDSFAFVDEMKDVVVENEIGRVSQTRQIEGNKVTLNRELVLRSPVVSTLEYPEFREIVSTLRGNCEGLFFLATKSPL